MFGWLRQAAGDWAVVGATFAETAVYMLTLSLAAAIFQPKLSELASLSWHARIWEAISVSSFGKIYTLVPTIWSSFSSDAGAVDQAIAVALSFFVALANVLALRTVLETLNKKTMFLMLKEINPSLQEAEFEARFRRIDGDGSGLIEFDEFVQWVYDDEVEVVGGAEKVKRTFEELAGDMDVSIRLIEYCYDCFKEELDAGTVDNYPTECATLPKEQACTLAQILVTSLDKKRFDRYWDTVDVQNKGAVTFDDFLELLDFEDMPEDVLAKYNDNED